MRVLGMKKRMHNPAFRLLYLSTVLIAGVVFAGAVTERAVFAQPWEEESESERRMSYVPDDVPSLPAASAPEVRVPEIEGGEASEGSVVSTNGDEWDSSSFAEMEETLGYHLRLNPQDAEPPALKTLFFTAWQYALLLEAKQRFRTAPSSNETFVEDDASRPTGPRELALGGIAYRSSKDWTIWLNSERITPMALPEQVMEITVKNDFIELMWFDSSTNLIFPVRLKPHQRFNLDSRIFLPGIGHTGSL